MYICVVAKYKEDISWTENLDCKFIILNKDPFDTRFEINYRNFGRESESYIRWIVENYNLLNSEDKIVFLQGNPFEHITWEKFSELVPTTNAQYLQSHLPLPIRGRWSYCFQKKVLINYPDGTSIDLKIEPDPLIPWNQTVLIADYLGLPKFDYLISHTGAQWVVPVKYILNKSKTWWENALSAHFVFDHPQKATIPYCFERLWETIWYHSDLEK